MKHVRLDVFVDYNIGCMIPLEDAVQIFVTAFSIGKSRSHPYAVEKSGPLWVMRDGPGKKGPQRKIEVVACNQIPETVVAQIAKAKLGWHFVCDIFADNDSAPARKATYKSLGYRALSTERFYAHQMHRIPKFECFPPARLVSNQQEFDSIPQRSQHSRKLAEGTRQFCIWDELHAYGWVYSRPIESSAWVGDLYVDAQYRGGGFGKAIMSKLLQTEKGLGTKSVVLLASKLGSIIYPSLGFEEIGLAQIFCPVRR